MEEKEGWRKKRSGRIIKERVEGKSRKRGGNGGKKKWIKEKSTGESKRRGDKIKESGNKEREQENEEKF